MNDLLTVPDPFPLVAIESIRLIFPYPRNRKLELVCVHKTLERLVQGETGSPMTPVEAITYLRGRLEVAKVAFAGRAKAYTPHLTSYLNGRRYLATLPQETPKNLEDAVSILACYPTVIAVDVQAHIAVLQVIGELIEFTRATHGAAATSYIRQRVARYRELVSRWPTDQIQYVPSPEKFFRERRHEQPDRMWERTPKNGYQSEREQIARIM
jgi:hypothetical protein